MTESAVPLPRIAGLEVDAMTPDLELILGRMAQVNAILDSREKDSVTDLLDADAPRSAAEVAIDIRNLPEILRTMLHHAELFAVEADIGIQLLGKGALAPRDRELAVLRIGWLCQAPYEWGEHVMIAKRIGITTTEIEQVIHGSTAPGWNAHERALLAAAEELHAEAMISDPTWAILAQRLSPKQLIELPILVGQYQTVAYYQNSLRMRLHWDNPGLAAR